MKPLCVLLVEDDPDYAALVLAWLNSTTSKQTFSVQWTDSLAATLARLQNGAIDVILLDLGLPDSTGVGTFSAIHGQSPAAPIVILTAGDEDALAMQAIQRGAQDFLSKPDCTAPMLVRTLRHAVMRQRSAPAVGPEKPASKLLAVVGAAGGVGTTTIASVMAAELRRQTAAKTLLIDLDGGFGQAAFTSGVEPQYAVQEAIHRGADMDESLWDTLITCAEEEVDILGSVHATVPAPIEVPDLKALLSFAANLYPWIVLDLGRLNHFSMQVVAWADQCVLATGAELQTLHQCRQTLEHLAIAGLHRERVHLVLNHKDRSSKLSPGAIRKAFAVDMDMVLPASHEELYGSFLAKKLPAAGSALRTKIAILAGTLADTPQAARRTSHFTAIIRSLVDATVR